MQLAKEGFLAQEGVTLLGANPETIAKAEDRQVLKAPWKRSGSYHPLCRYDDA